MAAKQWYAVVFKEPRPIGEQPDPKQHWHQGQLYSVGTVVGDDLPPWFEVVTLDGEPRPSEQWDPVHRCFVDVSDL